MHTNCHSSSHFLALKELVLKSPVSGSDAALAFSSAFVGLSLTSLATAGPAVGMSPGISSWSGPGYPLGHLLNLLRATQAVACCGRSTSRMSAPLS